jgi:hypothetical protein
VLKKIFFIAFFISLTFPRAGFYFQNIPVTAANILLGIVSLAWLLKRILNKKSPEGPFEWIALIYFGYVFFRFLPGITGGEASKAIIGMIVMAGYGVLVFVTLYFLKTKRDISFVIILIILSLGLTAGYGLLQVFFDIETLSIPGLTELYGSPEKPVVIYKDGWYQVISGRAVAKNIMWGGELWSHPLLVGHKIFSTFHHGNLYGLHLAVFIPFIFGLTGIYSIKKRIFLCLFLIMAMVVLIFANSRGALLGLSVGLITLMFLSPLAERIRIFSSVTISFLVFMLIISIAVFSNYKITGVDPSVYFYRNFEPRYITFAQNMAVFSQARLKKEYKKTENLGLEIDALSNKRFSLWRRALKDTFKGRTLREILLGNAFHKTSVSKLHNFYLLTIFEIGLTGFALFSLFSGYIILTSLRSLTRLKDKKLKAAAGGGIAGITAALTHNLFDFPFYYPALLANFWMLAGIVMVSVNPAADSAEDKIYQCNI